MAECPTKDTPHAHVLCFASNQRRNPSTLLYYCGEKFGRRTRASNLVANFSPHLAVANHTIRPFTTQIDGRYRTSLASMSCTNTQTDNKDSGPQTPSSSCLPPSPPEQNAPKYERPCGCPRGKVCVTTRAEIRNKFRDHHAKSFAPPRGNSPRRTAEWSRCALFQILT